MKLCLVLLLGCCLAQFVRGDDTLFSFVQITDSHLHDPAWIAAQEAAGRDGGRRNYFTTPTKFRQAVAWIDTQPDIAFVVLTGDITEKATPTRYAVLEQTMESLGKPWFLVDGNHDYGLRRRLPADGSRGGDDLWFSWQGVYFVGLSTFNPPGMSHLVRRDSLASLAAFRQAHPNAPMILLTHSPLLTRHGETNSWECPDNADRVAAVLARAGGCEVVLSGHDHGWWTLPQKGTLHVSAPGFCDALAPLPAYTFIVWQVSMDALHGEFRQVNADGRVSAVDMPAVEYQWPADRRPRNEASSWNVQPLPDPAADPLVAWFGADWVYAPGYALPPAWQEDAVLLAGQTAKPAVWLELPHKALPPADAAGRPWYQPEYQPAEPWEATTVPAGYWDHKNPRGSHRQLYLRITFDLPADTIAGLHQAVVKLMCYRSPVLYLNGQPLPAPASTAPATRWNGYAMVPPELLRPTRNVLAVGLTKSGWGGYKLDTEVAGHMKNAPQ